MSQPRVSILIPCYNAAPWLAATLQSVLAQTWSNSEIIVVDDGSSDASVKLAREFEPRGVRVIVQPNRGASAARNTALSQASGEWIQFLDADDLLDPDKISLQMHFASTHPGASLISGEWTRFESSPDEAKFVPESNWRDLSPVEFLQLAFEEGRMMHPAAWLARRDIVTSAGPWDEKLSLNDDGEYFARVMLKAGRIDFCPGARSFYRSNLRGSLSGRKDSRALESLWRSFDLTLGYLSSADTSLRTRQAVAFGWKWLAFELYPGRPELAAVAEDRCRELGGSDRPFPASGRFQLLSRIVGWRLAKRLCG